MTLSTQVAIIGSTGNIGTHVTNALLEEGYNVTVIARQDSLESKKDLLESFTKKGAVIKPVKDLSSVEELERVLLSSQSKIFLVSKN